MLPTRKLRAWLFFLVPLSFISKCFAGGEKGEKLVALVSCLLFLDDAVRMKLCLPTRQTWWFVQGTWCFCSGHVFRLQLTKVFLLKSFYQKTSYGRPKGNCFLCQLGVGDLKLMLYVNDVDIGCCRMYVSFCSIEHSWHMQNWSGKRLSCSALAMIICHWGWKAFALEGLPLFVILKETLGKRRKKC